MLKPQPVGNRERSRIGHKRHQYLVPLAFCLVLFVVRLPICFAEEGKAIDYAAAHLDRRLAMVKIHDKITIDGVLDEKIWEAAPVAQDFIQQEPREGVPMSYATEVKVLYNDENLYLAVIAHDPDAHRAVVNDLTKDFHVFDNDVVGIMLDTFRDRKNGYEFIVNPAGARYDSQMFNESDYNSNWDGVWYLRTKILEDRWIAEIAIPFTAIRFSNLPDQTWGINFWRIIRRKPYVLGSFSQSGTPGLPSTQKVDAGVDVKYGFGAGITLDATLNTDFSHRFNIIHRPLSDFFIVYNERRDTISYSLLDRALIVKFTQMIGH